MTSDLASPARSTAELLGPKSRLILLINLIAQVGIVVSGGLVRLTGSGLGCPTWPECTDGSMVPVATQSQGLHKFVEFGNRTLTFAVLVAAVAALIVVLRPALARRFGERWGEPGPTRRSLVLLASAVVAGIFGQAILGGITVLTDLNPITVASHFLLSMTMVAAAFTLFRRGREPGDEPRVVIVRSELRYVAIAIVALAIAVLALGTVVTGSGPHSGDADVISRFGFDPRYVSWLHSDVVLVFIGCALTYALGVRLTDAPAMTQRSGLWLIGACVVQAAIGYIQFYAGLPIGLVSLHMLGACLVWIASLNVFMRTRTRGPSAG